MYVCMYVCIYVYMHICFYVYIYIYICTGMYVCMRIYIYVYIYIYICVYNYIQIYRGTRSEYISIYIIYIYIYIYNICIYRCAYTVTYACMYVCMYVCTYVYVCVCVGVCICILHVCTYSMRYLTMDKLVQPRGILRASSFSVEEIGGASLAWMSSELLLATASLHLVEIAVRGQHGWPCHELPTDSRKGLSLSSGGAASNIGAARLGEASGPAACMAPAFAHFVIALAICRTLQASLQSARSQASASYHFPARRVQLRQHR